jgi:phosphoglycolate phosphatase-like HAD superfamily hydrolase
VAGKNPPVLIFDCDGVLLVSNRLKTRLFAATAVDAGFAAADAAWFKRHVAANFGTSRYRLFDTLLNKPDLIARPAATVESLAAAYARRLASDYARCPTTPGMVPILDGLRQAGHRMFVVSGSDQEELRALMRARRFDGYFAGIYGSPRAKADNLRDLLEQDGPHPVRPLFVGDAEADFAAAQASGATFVYMSHFSTAKPRMRQLRDAHGFASIRDLRELPTLLAGRIGA